MLSHVRKLVHVFCLFVSGFTYTREFFTQMERSQTSGVYLILRTVLQLRNEFLVARGITMKDTNTRYTNTHIFVISKHE